MNLTIEQITAHARDVVKKRMPAGYKPEALHIYEDLNGNPLYARVRGKHPDTGQKWIRPIHWERGRVEMGEPKFTDSKPLYGLGGLSRRPGETVLICEGENCVDALRKIGVLALTSGSAATAGTADWSPLAGRSVLLWPDNDSSGQTYAASVQERLSSLGCDVRVLDVMKLGMGEKEDAVDWLRRNAEAKLEDVLSLPTIHSQDEGSEQGTEGKDKLTANEDTDDSFAYSGGRYELRPDGLYFLKTVRSQFVEEWICSWITVDALSRSGESGDWGRWVSIHDADGVRHNVYLRAEALVGESLDVLRELSRRGLRHATTKSTRDLLVAYIVNHPTRHRVRTVDRLGWHGDTYVLPGEVIGQIDEKVICRTQLEREHSSAGSVSDWQNSVSSLAAGNSRLVFALSAAFAAPLLVLADEPSGGFHFRGSSSSGKTTLLAAAASVWGEPRGYVRQWRATPNGLEGLATAHNDGLLVLDELSQANPEQIGEAAYMLANGRGKVRADRNGDSRPVSNWRVLLLSSGEESLAALMSRAGQRSNAGQEIRLADLEVDAGAGMGAIEELHTAASSGELINALNLACRSSYGTVGRAWLEKVTELRSGISEVLEERIQGFVTDVALAGSSAQVQRMARRFAIVSVAGELATGCRLTGWDEGESEQAAKACFRTWLDGFGDRGSLEERKLLRQIRAYFETYGQSRFQHIAQLSDTSMPRRVGFCSPDSAGDLQYMVLAENFASELCTGFDSRNAARTLLNRGWIIGKNERATQRRRIAGVGQQMRVYVFTSKVFEDEI